MKYAIVMTDTNNCCFVNAVANAINYYNMNCELHLLYHYSQNDKGKELIQVLKKASHVRLIPLKSVIEEIAQIIPLLKEKTFFKISMAWMCKFIRYLYAVNMLKNYDAVLNMDSDSMIVNNLNKYFSYAHKTKRIVAPNNILTSNKSHTINKSYLNGCAGASSPPMHSTSMFFHPKTYQESFNEIVNMFMKNPSGDMVAINRVLIKHNQMKDVILLNNFLFIQSIIHAEKINRMTVNKKHYLVTQDGRKLCTTHRKWWIHSMREKFIFKKGIIVSSIAVHNIKEILSLCKFFNTELYYHLWFEEWDWKEPGKRGN